jgi:hypothetical protein
VDEMGRTCSTNGEKRNAYMLLVRKSEGKRPLEDQGVGGWIALRWILEMGEGSVYWIDLVRIRDPSRVFVNAVIKI